MCNLQTTKREMTAMKTARRQSFVFPPLCMLTAEQPFLLNTSADKHPLKKAHGFSRYNLGRKCIPPVQITSTARKFHKTNFKKLAFFFFFLCVCVWFNVFDCCNYFLPQQTKTVSFPKRSLLPCLFSSAALIRPDKHNKMRFRFGHNWSSRRRPPKQSLV
ncbi:hypothetical protein IscW_ISCW007962 [Ixodes scapularis]|uniref:Uncharacterized protein n=1 Tax=Ixodes scapularis TaxID=6945 RepID=B7PTG0_IXOSC|nr:hypothetical protein IscW_ISCW007962 [Ixodes scapularis]|eukprot:XP_002404394.1 hypothetical protein IscW_ISCW007962 [Ixodes scapularis]